MADSEDPTRGPGPQTIPGGGAGAPKKDDSKKPKKAEPVGVESKRAEKVAAQQAELANGDTDAFTHGYSEPKGTVHQDQFTTRFPEEGRHPRA